MKSKKSHIIALSGISAALSIISVIVACFFEPMTISLMALSGVFIMLPLSKGYWGGSVITYIVASIISFFVGNINAIPFIVFFGLYPIVQWTLDLKLAKLIKLKWLRIVVVWIIKLIYIELVVVCCWFLMQAVIVDMSIFGHSLTYLIFALGIIPIFVLYDLLMHFVYVNVKNIVDKKIKDNDDNIVDEININDDFND